MRSKLITVIPVYNGAEFIVQTLESLAAQTVQPDRVIVQDNRSTDKTEELVKGFKAIKCEWRQNEQNLGCFGNCNRALEFAEQTEYLHLICADDMVKPYFYQRLIDALETCDGRGLAYTLDERIDENNNRLSLSGKVTGVNEIQPKEDFLREKAEISNQAFSGSLLKTGFQKSPCQFRLDLPILADVVFWAEWGRSCKRIVRLHEPLAQYRWHGSNGTTNFAPQLQSLILDEWKVMQMLEQLRGASPEFIRQFKLRGLFAVRSGIKAKRFRQNQDFDYSRQIVTAARGISGRLPWYMAQVLVEARELLVYKIGGRRRHPKNVYG
jgi:glycosyltransferase involved in cell wall biosynthesis